jgi:hypothetical protein
MPQKALGQARSLRGAVLVWPIAHSGVMGLSFI